MFRTFDTVISVIFVFLLFSLVVSALRELIAAWMSLRGKQLEEGLNVLLNKLGLTRADEDKQAAAGGMQEAKAPLAVQFWDHPLIRMLRPNPKRKPSYLPSESVAAALLEIAGATNGAAGTVGNLKAGIAADAFKDTDFVKVIETAIEQSGANATFAQIQANLQLWIDRAMERVSSIYQRRTRTWLFIVSLVAAAALNVDAVRITKQLYSDEALRNAVVAQAQKFELPEEAKKVPKTEAEAKEVEAATKKYQERLKALTDLGLPMGWKTWDEFFHLPAALMFLTILGVFLTALAATLGAPFWFDLLKQFMNVRSVLKPEKKEEKK